MSSMFYDDPSVGTVSVQSFPQAMRKRLELFKAAEQGALDRLNLAGSEVPYNIADMSQYEQTGMDTLEQYLNSALPTDTNLWKSATGELEKTLSGESYDPSQGEYYQAYRTAVMRELQDAQDRLNATTSARDSYYGGGRIKESGNLQENAVNQLSLILGQLAENERQNRLTAAGMAPSFLEFGESLPSRRIAAATTFGSLPRIIEQAKYDAQREEQLRQLQDLGLSLDTALSLAMYQPTYTAYGIEGGEKDWFKDAATIAALVGTSGMALPLFSGGGGGGGITGIMGNSGGTGSGIVRLS